MGGGGVRQQGLVCEKEDRCQCWICFSGRQNCTVAILAQGTHWAVAVTQAFLPRLDSHGSHFLDPFHPSGLGVWDISGLATEPAFFSSVPGLANRAPTAQEHSPKRIAQSEEVLLPVGKFAGGGGGALSKLDLFFWKTKLYRSHFGSRYTLGCCGHASLFAQARLPWLSLSPPIPINFSKFVCMHVYS